MSKFNNSRGSKIDRKLHAWNKRTGLYLFLRSFYNKLLKEVK